MIGILLSIWPEFLTHVFSIEGDALAEQLVAQLPGVMIMVALCFVVDAWQLSAISILRGMKVVVGPTISTVIGYWFVGLPAAYLLMKWAGLEGIWGGLAIGLAATGVMLVVLLFKNLSAFDKSVAEKAIVAEKA